MKDVPTGLICVQVRLRCKDQRGVVAAHTTDWQRVVDERPIVIDISVRPRRLALKVVAPSIATRTAASCD